MATCTQPQSHLHRMYMTAKMPNTLKPAQQAGNRNLSNVDFRTDFPASKPFDDSRLFCKLQDTRAPRVVNRILYIQCVIHSLRMFTHKFKFKLSKNLNLNLCVNMRSGCMCVSRSLCMRSFCGASCIAEHARGCMRVCTYSVHLHVTRVRPTKCMHTIKLYYYKTHTLHSRM
jgi:hypothetical protein